MFSLRTSPARGARTSLCAQCARLCRTSRSTSIRPLSLLTSSSSNPAVSSRFRPSRLLQYTFISRPYSTRTPVDEIIDEIQDQYATAKDEFEIATEETEKRTTYAEGDRAAAREELDKLKSMFEKAVAGENGEEVRSRVGHRIRELDNAVKALERSAIEH